MSASSPLTYNSVIAHRNLIKDLRTRHADFMKGK